jgi:hypothetical protein
MAIPLEPISLGIQTLTGVASTVAQISDMANRRAVEEAVGKLTLDQQMALERELAGAKTKTDRLAILSNAVAMIRSAETTAKLQNLGKKQQAERQKEMVTIFLIVGLGLATVVTVLLIKKI